MTDHAGRDYTPCATGIHVCGVDVEADCFFTEANYWRREPSQAIADFHRAKEELAARDGEPEDFVVDLMLHGDIVEDFAISLQMLSRLGPVLEIRT